MDSINPMMNFAIRMTKYVYITSIKIFHWGLDFNKINLTISDAIGVEGENFNTLILVAYFVGIKSIIYIYI